MNSGSGLFGLAIGGIFFGIVVAILAVSDAIPAPEKENDGCTLISSVPTDSTGYCGRACTYKLSLNTYQCPVGIKRLVE